MLLSIPFNLDQKKSEFVSPKCFRALKHATCVLTITNFLCVDSIGRKRMMMLSNVPLLIAWCMLYRATSTWEIFIANGLLGLGSGMLEAPVIAYVGEIGEPEFRSFLMAYAYIGMTFGSLVVSVLNTLMPWRLVAMVCIVVPISNLTLLFFVSFHLNLQLYLTVFFSNC